jgi:F-box protein 9
MASKSLGQKPSVPSAATREQQQQPGADQQERPQQPQSMADLIASFSSLAIEGIPPEAEGMPQPPCPIATLPDELLVHVLLDVATQDVADFTRLSLVCKRFAYLVSTEQRIWRDVCLTDRFGFPGMLYHFSLAVEWDPLEDVVLDEDKEDGTLVSLTELDARRQAEKLLVTRSLTPSIYASWKAMFRHRPRIRFNGIYISTVNYVRSGQASTNQATWGGSPIHIVTYYRYLRFFRDGAVISLLTTNEPGDVVHHVTKDNLHLHRDRDKSHVSALPSSVMYLAQKGRWRLSSALDYPEADPAEQESDLFIETEGAGPKYMYRMNLSLRSAGKGAKNNKLIWRSFHSYNKLTDDWGEFTLKNDKPFFFSRVKSYGLT